MRLLLATGMEELNKDIKSVMPECFECYHRLALVDTSKRFNVDTVLLSPVLPGDKDLVQLVRVLRGGGTRIVLLPGAPGMPDTREHIIKAFPLGVYDFVYDAVTPEKVLQCLKTPRSMDDVPEELVKEAMARESVSREIPVVSKLEEKPTGIRGLFSRKGRPDPKERPEQEEESTTDGLDLSGLRIKANFPLPGAELFEGVPGPPADAIVIQAGDFELVRQIRRSKDFLTVPIVVFGSSDQAYFDAGADECVDRIDQETVQKISRMSKRLKDLWARSETDGLTGCYTRKFLDSYISSERRPFSVLMCDLDHFKQVNDTFGHAAGDEVLRRFGHNLRDQVRGTDVVVRYGGEEFVVILSVCLDRAEGIAQKVCRGWRQQEIRLETGVIRSTVSIGVGQSLKEADEALYVAKNAGRDRSVRFDQMGQKNPPLPKPDPERRVSLLPSKTAGKRKSRVFVFSSPARGCGATTIAITAAKALSACLDVLLVDGDFQNPDLGLRLGLPVRDVDSDWRYSGLGAMRSVNGFFLLALDPTRGGEENLGQYMGEIASFLRNGVVVIDGGQVQNTVPGATKIGVINGDDLGSYWRMYDLFILNKSKRGVQLRNVLGVIPYQSMAEIEYQVKTIFGDSFIRSVGESR